MQTTGKLEGGGSKGNWVLPVPAFSTQVADATAVVAWAWAHDVGGPIHYTLAAADT